MSAKPKQSNADVASWRFGPRNTRHLMALCVAACGVVCAGCLGDTARVWILKGGLLDAASGEPLGGSYVAVRLIRSGEPLGNDHTGRTGEDGTFEEFVVEGFAGSVIFLVFEVLGPSPLLGEPPDEVELLVRTPTEEGSVIIPVDTSGVTRIDEFTGEIQLPVVAVELVPRIESTYPTGGGARMIGLGDVDGDGDVDMVVPTTRVGSDDMVVLMNNGDGSYAEFMPFSVGDRPASVVVGDLNGDESPDLAVLTLDSDDLWVLLNDGEGGFSERISYVVGSAPYFSQMPLALGDLDGDSLPDLVATVRAIGVQVLLNGGGGTFGSPVTYKAGKAPDSVSLVELDGDGDLDIAVAGPGGALFFLMNNGDGTFSDGGRYEVDFRPSSLASGDFDGDDDADLALLGRHGVSILLNNGDGTFAAGAICPADEPVDNLAVGDLDDDGHLDLVIVEYWNALRNVLILANNGDATFRQAARLTAGGGPHFVSVGHLDANPSLDLLVANNNRNISIFLNPGSGASP